MKKRIVFCVLGVLIVGSLFIVFRHKLPVQSVVENDTVVTLPVRVLENRSFIYTKSFIGSVEAVQSVDIVPYLSAFLKEVRVSSGAEVNQNDVLFLLDDKIPLADLNQAKEAVSQALAQRENAKTYYERMQKTDKRAVSLVELEQAKTAYEASDAAFQKAVSAENQARTLYRYTVIQAPISGWVGNITATVGEYLSPESSALATIVRFSPVRLVFFVPLSAYNKEDITHEKATLQVVLSDKRILEWDNFQIVRDNKADKTTDSLSFFIDVPNDEKKLIPGAYVEVRFKYPETGILVDKNHITLTPDGAEAILIKNGRIEKQSVEIGAPIGTQYWVKSGLLAGDTLVTVPVSPFQIGQPAQGIPQ